MCFTVRLKSELKATVALNSIISFKNLCLYFLYNVIQFCPRFKLFAIRRFQSGFCTSKFTAYVFQKGVISGITEELLPAPSQRTIREKRVLFRPCNASRRPSFAVRTSSENCHHFLNSLQVAGKHWRGCVDSRILCEHFFSLRGNRKRYAFTE